MIWLVVALCGLTAGAAYAIAWAGRPEMTRFEDREQS